MSVNKKKCQRNRILFGTTKWKKKNMKYSLLWLRISNAKIFQLGTEMIVLPFYLSTLKIRDERISTRTVFLRVDFL